MSADEIYPVDDYRFNQTDQVLLDANVWLLVEGPQTDPSDHRVRTYSGVLKRIRLARSLVVITVTVLSEFINSYARLEYKSHPKATYPEFKDFRSSAAFKTIAEDIASASRRIVKQCRRWESGFSSLDIDVLLKTYASGGLCHKDFYQDRTRLCFNKG